MSANAGDLKHMDLLWKSMNKCERNKTIVAPYANSHLEILKDWLLTTATRLEKFEGYYAVYATPRLVDLATAFVLSRQRRSTSVTLRSN